MQGLKKFGLVVAVGLFGPLFLLSVFSFTFNRTLGSEDYTKQTIAEAGLYEAIGQTIKTQALGNSASQADPLITKALETAVTGDQLQRALEPLIGGTYAWLDGTTSQPQFALEIEPIKESFQQNLTSELQSHAAGLPVCPGAFPSTGEDIYTYNCIPRGTDVTAAINDAVTRVTNNASVFSDEVVADGTVSTEEAQELGISDPTQNLPDTLPKLFQFMTKGQWWFIVGTLLATVGVVLLSLTWLHGVRKLGVLLLINGLGVLIVGLILGYVVGTLVPTTSVDVTESAVNALEAASKIILADNAGLLKVIGLVITLLGVASLVASTILLRQQNPKPPTPIKKPPEPPKAPAVQS